MSNLPRVDGGNSTKNFDTVLGDFTYAIDPVTLTPDSQTEKQRYRQTNTHKNGTNNINSSASAGGKNNSDNKRKTSSLDYSLGMFVRLGS